MMQIFSSSSCWKAEKTAYLKHFWSLSPLKACVWTEKKKENATPHSLTSHLQRTKRCRFHFVERMRAIFTNNNPPLKTQGGGIKLVFCLGKVLFFIICQTTERGSRVLGTHGEPSDTAESIGWPKWPAETADAYFAAFVCSGMTSVWCCQK